MTRACWILAAALVAASTSPGLARAEPEIYGRMVIDSLYGYLDNGGAEDGKLETTFVPRLDLVDGDLIAVGEIELRRDLAGPDRDRLRIRRMYVDRRFGPVAVTLGNQVVAWGQMDAIRPVDRLNPHDFTDLIDDVTLEIPAARVRYEARSLRADAVFAPGFRASEFSTNPRGAWYPLRGITLIDPATGEPFPDDAIRFADAQRTSITGDSLSAGVRLGTTVAGVDLSVTYFNGPDVLPVSFLPVPDDGNLVLVPVTPRQNVFGLDFARTLGPIVVRGEAAYVLTEDRDATDPLRDDPYVQAALGAEWQRDGFGRDHRIVLLAELHTDRELGGAGPENADELPSLRHFFREAVVGNIGYHIGTEWELSAQSYYGIDTGDLLVRSQLKWRPDEGDLSLELRGHFLESTGDSFLTPFQYNDRAGVRVAYVF